MPTVQRWVLVAFLTTVAALPVFADRRPAATPLPDPPVRAASEEGPAPAASITPRAIPLRVYDALGRFVGSVGSGGASVVLQYQETDAPLADSLFLTLRPEPNGFAPGARVRWAWDAGPELYFADPDCQGAAYIQRWNPGDRQAHVDQGNVLWVTGHDPDAVPALISSRRGFELPCQNFTPYTINAFAVTVAVDLDALFSLPLVIR